MKGTSIIKTEINLCMNHEEAKILDAALSSATFYINSQGADDPDQRIFLENVRKIHSLVSGLALQGQEDGNTDEEEICMTKRWKDEQ